MAIEEVVRQRIAQLLAESGRLAVGDQYGQCTDQHQQAACSAWLTAAQNTVHFVCPSPEAPYRQKADRIATADHAFEVNHAVGELAAVLQALAADADAGLLASVADRARAETLDDFLDHADAYLEASRKNEAGVIAGVVFEDVLRRACRKAGLIEKDRKLDGLISELASRGDLSAVKAKRARAAADVRTKATHAQWDEFEVEDVRAAIDLTRELIISRLDAG
ncbi:MAG: hypothetical protein AB1806_00395 [Acidobacteriota bacterium]